MIFRAPRAAAAMGMAVAMAAALSCAEEQEARPDHLGPEAERIAGGLIEGGTERPPPATRCSLPPDGASGALIHGWKRDDSNWCCGLAKCIDRQACGALYGQRTSRCGDCTYYDCTYRPDLREDDPVCHWDPRRDNPRRVPE